MSFQNIFRNNFRDQRLYAVRQEHSAHEKIASCLLPHVFIKPIAAITVFLMKN